MYAETGQGLCRLRAASLHEGSPEGDKNEEGPWKKEVGRIKDVTDMRQENWSVRKLRKLLDNKIAAVENVMREGLESASTDYRRFFEWKAAYLYKGELLRGHYRLLRNKVSRTDDVEDLKRYFGDIAKYHRERLAGGTPAGGDTHPMADIARALSLECSRQVLKDCMEFSHLLSLRKPEQDVKEESRQPIKHRTNGLKR